MATDSAEDYWVDVKVELSSYVWDIEVKKSWGWVPASAIRNLNQLAWKMDINGEYNGV